MAKKFYLNDAAAAYNPAVAKGSWDDITNQPDIGQLGATPSGAYTTLALAETSVTNNWDVLLASFVSDALLNPVNFSTADMITGVLSVLESNALANDFTHIHIWVTTGNTDTVRGTLLNNRINTTEWPTTSAGQVIASVNLSNNVSALAGDHIVIELGYQAQNTSATSFTGTLGFGTGGGSDLADGSAAVTTNPSWISFSTDFGADVVLLGSIFDTNSGTHTVTATPLPNDLIVIVTASTGNTATTTPTDNNTHGGVYVSTGASGLKNTSADLLASYVRTEFIQYTVSTVFTHAPGASTGGGLMVFAVRGIAKINAAAIRQVAAQANQASGTPAPTFGAAVLTSNPVITAVFNGTNPGGITARTSPAYTRDINLGYITPTTGIDVAHVTSGETGTAITWGSSSATAFSSIAIELNMSITAISNQSDNFPGVALDATKWYDNTQAGATQAVALNAVTLTAPALTANALGEVEAQQRYTLIGSFVFVKAVATQVASANAEDIITVYIDEYGNQLQMGVINSNLIAGYILAGATTTSFTTAYNATTHAWWRIRESSGSILYDYSSDGITWTNLGSITTPMPVTLVRTSVATFNGDSSATPEVGVYSNFNIIQSAATTHFLSLLGVGS